MLKLVLGDQKLMKNLNDMMKWSLVSCHLAMTCFLFFFLLFHLKKEFEFLYVEIFCLLLLLLNGSVLFNVLTFTFFLFLTNYFYYSDQVLHLSHFWWIFFSSCRYEKDFGAGTFKWPGQEKHCPIGAISPRKDGKNEGRDDG